MFFVLDTVNNMILNCASEQKEIYAMVLDTLHNITGQANVQVSSFDNIEDEGFYFVKKDNDIELRQYYKSEGQVYDSFLYRHCGYYKVCEFNKALTNELIEELKEKIKDRNDRYEALSDEAKEALLKSNKLL